MLNGRSVSDLRRKVADDCGENHTMRYFHELFLCPRCLVLVWVILLAESLVRFANILVRSRLRNYRDQWRNDQTASQAGRVPQNRSDLAALCTGPRRIPAVIATTGRRPEEKPPWPEAGEKVEGESVVAVGSRGCACDRRRGSSSLDALRHPFIFSVPTAPRPEKCCDPQQKIPRKSLRSPFHGHSPILGSGR